MTIFDFLQSNKHSFNPVIGWKRDGRLSHLNLQEYKEQIEIHISLLKGLGFKAGDKIGIMANTSIEWHLFDMASMALGLIIVPLYSNYTYKDLEQIHYELKFFGVILGNEKLLEKYNKDKFTNTKFIIIDENSLNNKKINAWFYQDLLSKVPIEKEPLGETIESLNPNAVCSYLLTSGTTGRPKMSVITHANLASLLYNIQDFMKGRLSTGSRSLTNLPLAHVLGRCDSLLHLALPVQTVFGESVDTLVSDLQIIKPSYIVTVPRLITKLKEKIIQNIHSKGFLFKKSFDMAISFSQYYFKLLEDKKEPNQYEKIIFMNIQNKLLKKIREQISPEIKFLVSGGAPLKSSDFDFFKSIGIPILEGYGLTETLGPVTLNSFSEPERGSVGLPFKDITIKIDDDGEILIHGPSVFQGYLKENGDIDKSCFIDGFFKTGDIGEILPSGNLKITDRKKDIIVTSNGKNISPQKIENLMATSPRIEHFMTVGEGRNYLTGLISITKESFSDLIDQGTIDASLNYEELAREPNVHKIVSDEVKRLNIELPNHEQIKKFTILPLDINWENDYLTPSLKIKRDRLYNKYIREIDAMYP